MPFIIRTRAFLYYTLSNILKTQGQLVIKELYMHKGDISIVHENHQNRSLEEVFQDGEIEEEDVKLPPGRTIPTREIQVHWKDFMLRPELMKIIKELKFEYPSEVQRLGIVEILQGKNLICQAKSGTGKTAVFVISILQLLEADEYGYYLPHQCFVMVPTRELAHQILKEFLQFSKYIRPKISISAFFGGVPIQNNVTELANPETSPAIIISTPGRLNDLYQRNYIILQNCKYFVLDQCDKMLDNPKMKADFWSLYEKTPEKKQSLMFSATITSESLRNMRDMIRDNCAEVKIQEDITILNCLTQYFLRIPEDKKYDKLKFILDNYAFNQCIIFMNRIDRARRLISLLKQNLYNPISMNSSLKQEERIVNYDLFKQNSSKLLVATDVFGRGIDMTQVNLVINYDFPRQSQTYLHRVSRAGRFGAKGVAINFVKIDDNEGKGFYQNEDDLVGLLRQRYGIKIQLLPEKFNIADNL